jgi:hypothetical protein
MIDTTHTDHLSPQAATWSRPASALSFAEQQIRTWRDRARMHLAAGDPDLARSCERNAMYWEDR